MSRARSTSIARDRLSLWLLSPAVLCLYLCISCARPQAATENASSRELTMMQTLDDGDSSKFTSKVLDSFRKQTGIKVASIEGYDHMETRLDLYQRLFAIHATQPDICGLDNIWPGILSDDLIDLKPYVADVAAQIDQTLLDAFTVKGRLVGLPIETDTSVLYYRADLLKKYGFSAPPATWDELESMARLIQTGERKNGHRDFWGYVWQGAEGEALTCNALEWQQADGAPLFDGSNPSCVLNPAAESVLTRARRWVGTISPPGVVEYDEEDSNYIWLAGSAAFVRGWTSLYGSSLHAAPLIGRFATAPMPAGIKGRANTFGGMALGVSRFSRYPSEAAAVVRLFSSAPVQRQSLITLSNLPTHTSLLADQTLMRQTAFSGWHSKDWNQGMFTRPSSQLGKDYPEFSRLYSSAVNEAISGRRTPHEALAHLRSSLESMVHRRTLHP